MTTQELRTAPRPSSTITDLFRSKVPQVVLVFWIIKIFSTTVGETLADWFNDTVGLGLTTTTLIFVAAFIIALVLQMRSRRYVPAIYWLTVVIISVVGTLITDNMTDVWAVPLGLSVALFSVLLATTFIVWRKLEGTLSIHSILTPRREALYWLAILFTFALGTALGDFLGEQLGLGYLMSAVMFAAVIAVIAIAHFGFKANATLCFWAAYVMTRPLGASFGDLASQAPQDGGLGLGTTWTSLVFLVVILAATVYETARVTRQRSLHAAEERELELQSARTL